jgi:hypothetical protein
MPALAASLPGDSAVTADPPPLGASVMPSADVVLSVKSGIPIQTAQAMEASARHGPQKRRPISRHFCAAGSAPPTVRTAHRRAGNQQREPLPRPAMLLGFLAETALGALAVAAMTCIVNGVRWSSVVSFAAIYKRIASRAPRLVITAIRYLLLLIRSQAPGRSRAGPLQRSWARLATIGTGATPRLSSPWCRCSLSFPRRRVLAGRRDLRRGDVFLIDV